MKPPPFDFEAMRNVDVRTVDPATLVDINAVTINTALPFIDKAYDYLKQTGNPYCFRCGDVVIKLSYSRTNTTMTDCIEEIIRSYIK